MQKFIAGTALVLAASGAMSEHRFGHIAPWQGNVFALVDIVDAAAGHRMPHRFTDLISVATQETFPVAYGFVFARQASVDNLLEHGFLRL